MTDPKSLEIKRLLDAVKQDRDVLAVMIFGSFARGEAQARDVDVCLVLYPEALKGIDMARKTLGYAKKFDLDIHIYQALPVYIQVRILKEGHVELVKDDDKLYEIAIRTAQVFEDFRPRYLQHLEGVAHHG